VWEPVPTRGPLLGVVDDATYPPEERWLARGDAVVVYTDGVVESPRRTLDDGVDRLLGEAEGLLREGLAGGARRLVERTVDDTDDDATLVLIWRS
jgi:serine phosphatase RsbU (regulator of sigma subunit)